MHLYKFTKEQKFAFLALTLKNMAADNVIKSNESGFFELMKLEMGLDHDVTVEDKPLNDLLAPFNTRVTKIWLIQELMGMAYVDDHFANEEYDWLKGIAKNLGITNQEFDKIRGIVLKTREIVKETNSLVRGK